MVQKQTKFDISGEEQSLYLISLDRYLKVLQENLSLGLSDRDFGTLKSFGDSKNWDWKRLPDQKNIYQDIADFVENIRQHYRYFSWQNHTDPVKNMGWFDSVGISTISGMPGIVDFIELHRLKKDCNQELSGIPAYERKAEEFVRLIDDFVEPEGVAGKADEIHKSAMKRNFLENLADTTLIPWNENNHLQVKLVRHFADEELYNIRYARFWPPSSMFEIFIADVWQDLEQPEIKISDKGIVVSEKFRRYLPASEQNNSWFVLKEMDEAMPSIHPVHVSRALIGPFENRFMISPRFKRLDVTNEILQENINSGLLRFSREYAYAPNHEEIKEQQKQIVYQEKWSDEVIVCPAEYSERVSKSVLGTNVRIFEV